MRQVRGSIRCCARRSGRRTRTTCGSSRAATSWCRSSSTTTAAYFFQNADNRIIFAIPYEGDFTLIGTTDEDFKGDPTDVAHLRGREPSTCWRRPASISPKPVTREEIVWTYSGVRPLFDDGASAAQEATRDYVMKIEGDEAKGAAASMCSAAS